MKSLGNLALILALASASFAATDQQSAPLPSPLTLEVAVNYAIRHYPQVRAALERRAAANSGITLARTAYLPRANALWQGNRATRNNLRFTQMSFVLSMLKQPGRRDPSSRGSNPLLFCREERAIWARAEPSQAKTRTLTCTRQGRMI